MRRYFLALLIFSSSLSTFLCAGSRGFGEDITVVLSFPSSGEYVLKLIVAEDGTAKVSILPITKVNAKPVKPDNPAPTPIPQTEIQKIASDAKFASLKPFFPKISAIYAEKDPESVREEIAKVLPTQELKDTWAILGGRLSSYYDSLDPQPEVEDFMKSVAKDLSKL